jgi:CTP:molybdopterin cytidylyltransferase MocA
MRVNALILAGNRGGTDAISRLTGVSHKALAPIGGVPMLQRVLQSLTHCAAIEQIYVCIDDVSLLEDVPALAAAYHGGLLKVVPPAASPAASVASALHRIGLDEPLLITTADHPLLTPEMISHFLAHAPADGDLAVALARLDVVQAAYPQSIRTGYRLGGERYSGCNLFLARRPAAAKIATFWQRMEKFRKKPWRLVLEVGPFALLRLVLGQLDLKAALKHLSRRTGAEIRAVDMPFAEAAIDVDKPADYELVTAILQRRENAA